MRATGIVRRVDDLGRVVIPKEIRRTLTIRENDPLEIFTEDGCVIFKKYAPYAPYETKLASIKAEILKEDGMDNKLEILRKINEITELLRAEANHA